MCPQAPQILPRNPFKTNGFTDELASRAPLARVNVSPVEVMRFGRSGVAGSQGPRPIPGRPTLWSEIREIGPYRPQDRYSKLEICDKLHIFGQFPQRVALTLSALAP